MSRTCAHPDQWLGELQQGTVCIDNGRIRECVVIDLRRVW